MNIDLPFLYRIRLANFECSGHALMIETDSHLNIDCRVRLCLQRNAYAIEEELHFPLA